MTTDADPDHRSFITVVRNPVTGQYVVELRKWDTASEGFIVAECSIPLRVRMSAGFVADQWGREMKLEVR